MSENINKILSLFGSHANAAKAAGVKWESAVTNWKARDSIPHHASVKLLRNCAMFDVSKDTLFELLMVDYYNVLETK